MNQVHKETRETGARITRDARAAGLGAWRSSRTAEADRTLTLRITRKHRADAEKLAEDMDRFLRGRAEVRWIVDDYMLETARGWQVEIDVEIKREVPVKDGADRPYRKCKVCLEWGIERAAEYVSTWGDGAPVDLCPSDARGWDYPVKYMGGPIRIGQRATFTNRMTTGPDQITGRVSDQYRTESGDMRYRVRYADTWSTAKFARSDADRVVGADEIVEWH